jgi:shikimate dehydrogenase
MSFTGAAKVAGVAGQPVRQSLSPLIHNAWIAAAGLDAIYVPFAVAPGRFEPFLQGLRVSGVVGLNVTLPFKEDALRLADEADEAARAAGAANRLLIRADGSIEARNTDGLGLLQAFVEQAPQWRPTDGPVLVLGAGGAARGAAAALRAAGATVRVVNRTAARAEALAESLPGVQAWPRERLAAALGDVTAVINATAAGLEGQGEPDLPFSRLPSGAVVMDMVYKPLRTTFLRRAAAQSHQTVDGLAMLIGQAAPAFEAFFGEAPPLNVDVRTLALRALGEAA